MKTDSLERIVPDALPSDEATGSETYQLHLERYGFATRFASGHVLDAACGVGYGSYHIATLGNLHAIVGVDLDEGSVDYARERYAHPSITFVCSDIMAFRPNQQFDVIISLETIEHVPDPKALIAHFCQLLRPGGIFIGSVPVTPSVDANPHHLTDFTERGFKKLLESQGLLVESDMKQVQSFSPVKIVRGQEKRAKDIRPDLAFYYLANPNALLARIWSTVCYGFTNRYMTVQCRKV